MIPNTQTAADPSVQVPIDFGRKRMTVEIPENQLIRLERAALPPPLGDPIAAVREGLESPLRYPALRRALTPDDHVTIVVDEHLPRLPELLTTILEHIASAGVAPEAMALLCPPTTSKQPWIEDLPDAFQDVRLEVHDPADPTRRAYLATTKAGRRVYLNRSAVDADQLVVLTGPRFDPVLGYAGAEGAVFPGLSDVETRTRSQAAVIADVPAEHAWPVRREAGEVSWLLGAPFYVQVVEGPGDDIVQVICGSADTSADGRRGLDRCWRATVPGHANVVIATISGDPGRHGIAEMAQALACAARVVRPDGVIALLCASAPELCEGFRQILRGDDPDQVFKALRDNPPPDWPAAFQWLHAVRTAHVYLLSELSPDTAEGLFTTPMELAQQVQRLIDGGETCVFLPDAHKLMVTVA
jgi:nickel-dependent lactate racemase